MRSLVNVKELLEYCEVCRICKSKRIIEPSVYPDDAFTLESWKLKDDHLLLYVTFETKGKRNFTYKLTFDINCEDNTIETKTREITELPSDGTISTANSYKIELGIYAKCENACSYINSIDLELDIVKQTCSQIGIDSEHAYVFINEDNFKCSLWFDYVTNVLQLSNMSAPDPSLIALPIIDFDFSDLPKLKDKLTTLIVFS